MPTYIEIAVNVPQVTGVFHYHLPVGLEDQIRPGCLVTVPFGQQTVQGVALRFVSSPAVADTRPVLDLLDPIPALTPAQLALASYLSDASLASLAACIGLMIPPGLAQRVDTLFEVVGEGEDLTLLEGKDETQRRLLELIRRRGPLRGSQIDSALPRLNWRPAARRLVQRGLLRTGSVLPPPRVRPKFVRTVQLAAPPEVVEAALPSLGKSGTNVRLRREAILRFLLREPEPVDVAWVYAESGGNLSDLQTLAERGLAVLGESEVWRDPLALLEFVPNEPPPLTRDQARAWERIEPLLRDATAGVEAPPIMLHGVTGSGKTEVYLRAVEATLGLGRQAIVLVPEIALTPQTLRRFAGRFPGRVGLYHSRLTEGERYDTWRRARAGLLSVVVGPRSALFTPFPDLGLIVVDEFHDDSYYQGESEPRYHAREVALAYARLAGAAILLGSATPDVTTLHRSRQEAWLTLALPARILAHKEAVAAQVDRLRGQVSFPAAGLPGSSAAPDGREATDGREALAGREAPALSRYHPLEGQAETIDLPPVKLVDMRQELKAGNRSIFSRLLQKALGETLDRGQQAILFLNRRGTATYVFCRECGYTVKCPRCELPLSYHADSLKNEGSPVEAGARHPAAAQQAASLLCHHCGYRRQVPRKCPECGGSRIRHFGAGTERVEAEVQALFPQARTLRWDYETTRGKLSHEIILSHFTAHRADVLIGTQMLAKGLDLPFVTLVGVVLADVGLNLPDFRASERTFQLLTQVAGRAGRSPLGGQVVLQTFQPHQYAIRAAAEHDWETFYSQELEYRRQLGYPPFSRLVRLEYRHADPARAERAALEMAGQVRAWLAAADRRAIRLIGPAPCFFQKIAGQYRWQIILRGPEPVSLLRGRPLGEWRVEVDPPSLL